MKKLDIVAYEYIKEKILNNEYKAKQIISEKDLAKDLNISKTPVKIALENLKKENFVIINPRKSVCIKEVDLKLIKDVFQIRSIIEPLLVELTISYLPEGELKLHLINFRSKFEKMSKKTTVKTEDFDKLYDSYRYFFAKNCGNLFLSQKMELVYDHLHRIRKILHGTKYRRLEAVEEHIEIINKILNKNDIKIIKDLCSKHIEAAQISFFKNINMINL
ncbi:GntR family transcriptional regulator [Oceanivirga salmonicida]|uniref:GntR family transcriptional regulator n=1 Tax=Oceanivirga salmonicida TaxID=1769291 RepID=UPI00082AFA49|nr:GntR family transcriptional regulator [Oceanivirga salmonicida]